MFFKKKTLQKAEFTSLQTANAIKSSKTLKFAHSNLYWCYLLSFKEYLLDWIYFLTALYKNSPTNSSLHMKIYFDVVFEASDNFWSTKYVC